MGEILVGLIGLFDGIGIGIAIGVMDGMPDAWHGLAVRSEPGC
jgi:hypothetical protein